MSDWWASDPVASKGSEPERAPVRITVGPAGSSQGKQSQWWESDPEAPSAAMGLLKAGASGVAHGALAIPGLPGDLLNLSARGAEAATNFITDKLGLERPPPFDPSKGILPTAESVTEHVKSAVPATAPLLDYKPQNVGEEYAKTLGEFLPAGLSGPAGLGRKALLQVAAPAVATETAGQATKGTPYEGVTRGLTALASGGIGSVLAQPTTAARAIHGQLPEGITNAHVAQAEALIQEAQARGVNLTWPEALSQVAGQPVLTDMQRILESAPQSRTAMQHYMAQRPQQVDQAALAEFGNIAPGTAQPANIGRETQTAAQGAVNDVRDIINRHTEPFYTAASTIRLTPQEMAQVRAIPGYQEARQAIRGDPQLNRYVAHLPDDSVGFLNEVKKYLDQQGNNATSKFNPTANQQRAAGYTSDAAATRQVGIDAGNRAVPGGPNPYEVALNTQEQTRRQFLEPLLAGPLGKLANQPDTKKAINALFPANPLPNSHHEIDQAVSALAARNPWAANQLVRAHAEMVFNEAAQNLQSGANQFGGAKFAARIAGNPQQRENLRAAIEALPNGHQTWQGFESFLDIMEATGRRQAKGSLTSFNTEELKRLSGGGAAAEAVKTGASPAKWFSFVSDKYTKFQLGRNLDQLATIITDPNAGRLLRRIADLPRDSTQAAIAVGRLLAQTNAATQEGVPLRVTVGTASGQPPVQP